ncbi:MAG: DUF5011 domain-containing protein [Bacteroidetes bacterium]|nr:MAG: DUF5011 domain-containing protein [Bacteroidota bacterium]
MIKHYFQTKLWLVLVTLCSAVGLNAQSFTFTPAGATGQNGPTQAQINIAYQGGSLDGNVLSVSGIQYWIVPITGIYRIETTGAQGYGPFGGRGAKMTGEFFLNAGDTLKMAVGQAGGAPVGAGTNQYGGGGGTFVTKFDNTPLIIAGGGGGSWASAYNSTTDANIGTSGNDGVNGPANNGVGGINGNGGNGLSNAGAGAGLLSDATGDVSGGDAFVNGAVGGRAATNGGEGGFGGGGGASSYNNRRSGGGGGYSGGGSSAASSATAGFPEGGGGGSYNAGDRQNNVASVGYGDGEIVITILSTGAYNDAGAISVDEPKVFCSGLNDVIVSVRNFGANRMDSVRINWMIDTLLQPSFTYVGTLDTIGGTGSNTVQVNLGAFNFGSGPYAIKVWTSHPGGGIDTVNVNDTVRVVRQANLPPPTNLSTSNITTSSANLKWEGGNSLNTWAYVLSTSASTPVGPGTIVSVDSVVFNNLASRRTYYFYVREICASGDSSVWEGPISFRTDCGSPLAGTYTLDKNQAASTTNFVSFEDAALALAGCGVNGPVDIYVSADTYTERIELPAISGASSANLIRFIGAGIGQTILTYNASSTADHATWTFDGADFVELRDMTIGATNATNAIGVMFTNQADSNAIRNVNIEVSTSATGTGIFGVVFSGDKTSGTAYGRNGDYNHLDSVNITGGYYAIRLNGESANYTIENRFTNMSITNFYMYGIYAYYNKLTVIDNSTIQTTRNTGSDGIYTFYLANPTITNNTIVVPDYGIYFSNLNPAANYDSGIPSLVANNKIISTGDYGVYQISNGGALRFVHNSVNVNSGYAVRLNGGSRMVVANNHMRNYRTTAASYAFYTTGSFDTLDYNNYFSLGSGDFLYDGTAYSDFARWKSDHALVGQELFSYNVDPNFISNTDLHIDQTVQNLRGIDFGMTLDADGDVRCEFAPTLGADESNFATPIPTAQVVSEDSIYVNSPSGFYSAYQPLQNVLWDYTWYVNGSQESKSVDFTKTFGSTGTYQLILRARSCSGADRDTLMVNVINPSRVPATDFTASKLILNPLEETKLSDLSEYGATQWEWTVVPSTNAFFDNPYSNEPTLTIFDPGSYEICLQTANSVGQGNKLCKRAYISVNDDRAMCASNRTTNSAGRLTDENGVLGNYTPNTNCNFTINPCAGQVVLRFTEWGVNDANDKLYLYNGLDANAPLLGVFDGTSSLPGGVNGIVANSGKMHVVWTTDGAGQGTGFVAYWSSIADTTTSAPVADFNVPDSIFVDQIVEFTSTSQGQSLNYVWDFDLPNLEAGLDGGTGMSDRYSWNAGGQYPVRLMVSNCGGVDTMDKMVDVIAPTSAPVPGFTASRLRLPVLSTLTLTDTSRQGPATWNWEITPAATVNILSKDQGPQMQVAFMKSGLYTVKLKVSNSVGVDSVVRVDYIEVFDYCAPVVGNISSDVAISRVQFGGIDNYSSVGVDKYTSYINDFNAEVLPRRSTFDIRLERMNTQDPMNRKVWIDWNNDGDFNDSLELVAYEASANTQSYTATVTVPDFAVPAFTLLRVGVSYGADQNRACGINPTGEFEDYPVQIIIDNEGPVITMLGQDTVYVEQGYQYTDAGATALDNVDGNRTSFITLNNTVDTSMVGNYFVKYNVLDVDGNAAVEQTRVVIVTPDVTAPVITLTGANSVNVTVLTTYTDDGATASDYFQQNLNNSLSFSDNIDMTQLGTYHYWYTVQDAAGNYDSVAREVNVIDDVNPVVIVANAGPIVIDVYEDINAPAFNITDNFDPNPVVVIDSSAVDKTMPGIYDMVYTGMDGSGNTSSVIVQVEVKDLTLPVITLIGSDTVIVDVYDSYNEQGAQVTDNYCNGLTWSVMNQPMTSVLGDYVLSYNAVDCQGNAALTVNRVVRVVDREAPVVELNGFAVSTIIRWQGFNDPGVTIVDNYYDNAQLQDSVKITSNLDPNTVGVYSMCYRVTDLSGNTSSSVCRTVNVVENLTSVSPLSNTQIKVYPNPSAGQFNLEFAEALNANATIQVYDMTGKLVMETTAKAGVSQMQLNLNANPGMYHVRISDAHSNTSLKLEIIR